MNQTIVDRIIYKILQLKPKSGEYFVLMSHIKMMDYSVQLSYNEYLNSVSAIRNHELNRESFNSDVAASKVLANARFFFESIYGFVYMFEKLSKEKSEEPVIKLLKDLFTNYKHLKMPRVKVSKDHFSKLIWAEATNNKKVINELTGDSKFLYEFSADPSGLVTFQGKRYDPHQFFREYTELLDTFEQGLDTALSSRTE